MFHFGEEKGRGGFADKLTPRLKIDDKVLSDIIYKLYAPSPYNFRIMSPEILGHVYEQFLGKVIRLDGTKASIEEKPEVRKAGGVYYTPSYIVNYIVAQTVGKLCEGKTPVDVSKLKVLDPACGSGSFLIGAYDFLLEWHLDYYIRHEPEKLAAKREPVMCSVAADEANGDGSTPAPTWRLTTREKKRILLANIHGVDIDRQAVEVTKLSLLLKMLEDDSDAAQATMQPQLLRGTERLLPDLEANIKCGNSLIGHDFYESDQEYSQPERERINAFDWDEEFPAIMKRGGFDAVIGNPPWVSLSGKFGNELCIQEEINYLIKQFNGNTYMPNLYEYFVGQGLTLTRTNGYFSLIVPDRLGYNSQFIGLRNRILRETHIESLLYKAPFPKIVADTLIFSFHKVKPSSDATIELSEFGKVVLRRLQADLLADATQTFQYFESVQNALLIEKINSHPTVNQIGKLCDSTSGYGGKSQLIQEHRTSSQQIPILKGASIGRYAKHNELWFDFKPENITGRTTDKTKLGAVPKILLRKTGDHIVATYDESGVFPEQSLYFLYNFRCETSDKYLLGILNSKLMTFFYRAKSLTNKSSIAQVKKVDLDQLPIRTINFSGKVDTARHDAMVKLVERMLELQQQKGKARTAADQTQIERQIAATDKRIDALVYELYELTDEEIALVENAGAAQ